MNKHYLVKIGISTILFCIVLVIVIFYNDLAINFSKDNYKGEFFKVILTSLGGLGVVYGLYLNSKRIQEQTRQNSISEKVNIDNRFGEALGYLNSENTGIVLGGIHVLYKIAIEDIRYKEIISNIFCNYIENKSEELYKSDKYDIINLILQRLLSGYFSKITINNSYLINITAHNCIAEASFNNCHINNCTFFEMVGCTFWSTNIENTAFKTIVNNSYNSSQLNSCNFTTSAKFISNKYQNNVIKNCVFEYLKIKDLVFEDNITENCKFKYCKIFFSRFIFCEMSNIFFSSVNSKGTEYKNWDNEKMHLDKFCSGIPIDNSVTKSKLINKVISEIDNLYEE